MTTATQPLPRVHDHETSPGTGETGAKDPTEPMAVLALVEADPDTTYEDVAKVLNISKTTVYRRVQEARRQREIQAAEAGNQSLPGSIRAAAQAVIITVITLCAVSVAAALWVIALKLSRAARNIAVPVPATFHPCPAERARATLPAA